MPTTGVRSAQERIEREARVSGLRDFRTPTLEAVERRRLQLWFVAIILLVALTGGLVLVLAWPSVPVAGAWRVPLGVKLGILGLALAFCAYVVEKELALRRLTKLLVEERVLSAALSNRLKELSTLAAVGKAVNSVLGLKDVLNIILSSALELLEGAGGSIMLIEDREYLRAVCVAGNEEAKDAVVKLGWGVAGQVALSQEPILLSGPADPDYFSHLVERVQPVDSAVCVPLVNRGELLGVLNVSAKPERPFTEYDLRAMTLFAEHAAISIANARLYEAEVERVAELLQVNKMKSDFLANVSHELRTPLTAILGSVLTMKGLELDREQQTDFLDTIERQGRRLLRLIEELLTASQLERERGDMELQPVDLAALARTVARDMEMTGDRIQVLGPDRSVVMGEADLLQQVLVNLVDNAHKHGQGPVQITIEQTNGSVVLSVVDRGRGVAHEDRERIFERFIRLDESGSRPGIGLGLPIVRELLNACGGKVWVEDGPGGGAAFHVSLSSGNQSEEAVS